MRAKALAFAVSLTVGFAFVCADVAQAKGRRKSAPPQYSYQTSQSRLPGLHFWGEPYSWQTPGARVREPAEVYRSQRYREAVSIYRPSEPSGESARRATRINRVRMNELPQEPEVREIRRPSGVAEPKATRVIPLFNVPQDQQGD